MVEIKKKKREKHPITGRRPPRFDRPIIGIILLITIVAVISVVVYLYVENMGDYAEGYILSNEPEGLNFADDGSREYHKLIMGKSPDATQDVKSQFTMLMVYETHNLEPPEIGDHVRIYYDTESPVFVAYKIKYI